MPARSAGICSRIWQSDGSIKHNKAEGSIHKIAATILGAESCNGWTYWHYQSGNTLKPIDELRQRLRPNN
jgi:site-specific DNA-methyltransferase (adenine-specific)/modification methylase